MDPLRVLPVELSLGILELLDARALGNAEFVSTLWQRAINDNDYLWKYHCEKLCISDYIKRDRKAGYSWKETLQRNYGSKQFLKNWINGTYNQNKCYHQMSLCRLDTEDWGRIIDAQFARDSLRDS